MNFEIITIESIWAYLQYQNPYHFYKQPMWDYSHLTNKLIYNNLHIGEFVSFTQFLITKLKCLQMLPSMSYTRRFSNLQDIYQVQAMLELGNQRHLCHHICRIFFCFDILEKFLTFFQYLSHKEIPNIDCFVFAWKTWSFAKQIAL